MNTYYLSADQFIKFWKISLINNNCYTARIDKWENNYRDKFNLEYIETGHPSSPAFHGAIKGKQKYITLFLLQL